MTVRRIRFSQTKDGGGRSGRTAQPDDMQEDRMHGTRHILTMGAALLLSGLMALQGMTAEASAAASATSREEQTVNTQQWDKVFAQSDRVTVSRVRFANRYGIELAGDLYVPKHAEGRLAAIAISGPFGAVKEQVSGLYAQTMAERGFVTLAFDPSYTGESGGTPRHVSSPEINTEDFSAAVDFLSGLDQVDPGRVGVIGICGFGGFGVNVAAMDTRIRATAAITMYDMTRVTARGYFDSMDEDARYQALKRLNAQRLADVRTGKPAPQPGLPENLTGDEPQFVRDYYDYYKTSRGFHPRSINSNGHWNATAALSLMNMPILTYAEQIRSAVLLVHGEKAHSRYFSEDLFKRLRGENKELLIVPGASHVDLYDQVQVIPWQRLEDFFSRYLALEA